MTQDTATDSVALRFETLTKSYGRQLVLDKLSLEVRQGEFFGLVGVNGAGKTTCIKGLLDFCSLSGGNIEIFGEAHTLTRSRRRLAYLPERFLPPYYLTGRDFLAYMAKLYASEFDEASVLAMLETLDLDVSSLDKSVRVYSKGMAQKLGLAACFLSRKDLIVLDEPMSGLDPKARILVKRFLHSLKSQGHTLFFSTPMLADVEELCDRMGILHDGRLRFVGAPGACCEAFGADSLEQAYLNCIGAGSQPS